MMRRLLAMVVLLACGVAHAHTLSVSHVDLVPDPRSNAVTIELDLALKDLALTLPLDANHDERITWGELQAARPALDAWIATGFGLSADGAPCRIASEDLAIRRYDDGAYASLRLRADCNTQRDLRVHYALLFDRDPQHRALVTWHLHEGVSTGIARVGAGDVALPDRASLPFLDFFREGVHHILIGYDHLAFLLSLLLPAALARRDGDWIPASTLRDSLGHVLGIVTAFTLAHSITLSLAALGWVMPASRWVESGIAASVVLAAVNNVTPVVTRRIWCVGFGFGLVHGFGFAGALSELGLPRDARLASLVGFNLGVEAGQLLVVALVLPLLFAVRGWMGYRRWLMPAASIAIAGLAGVWLVQRIAV